MAQLVRRHDLPAEAEAGLRRLLAALEDEPDPPTAVRSPEEAVQLHLADSLCGLEVGELSRARRIADIGSGAGFPGLPLALALPGSQVDLIESARRKCEVIERLTRACGATSARVVHARAEEWAAREGREAYGAVAVRAVGALAVLVEYACPLLEEGGVMVAWKGARDPQEEHAGRTAAKRLAMAPREVLAVAPFPGTRSRHLHVYEKVGPTPPGIPRRPGMATKRPLG